MSTKDTEDKVWVHLKLARQDRERLQGLLRAEGRTMQSFFNDFVEDVIEHPSKLQESDYGKRVAVQP